MSALQDQIVATANAVRLPSGSSQAVARVARRRNRRAQVGKAAAVVLGVAAAGVGVHQLSRDDGDIIQSGPENADVDTETGRRASGSGGGPGEEVGSTTAPQRDLGALVPTRPAKPSNTEYRWAAYPTGSSSAIALRFDPSTPYAISTADGTIDERAVFEQSNGAWTQLTTIDGIGEAMIVGDKVYVDPEPGENAPRALQVFDIPSRSWTTIAPPTIAEAPESDVLVVTSLAAVSASGDDVVMLAERTFEVDAPALGLPQGWQISDIDSRTVSAYNAYCVPSVAESTSIPASTTAATVGGQSNASAESTATLRTKPDIDGKDTTDCLAEFATSELQLSPAELAIVDGAVDTLYRLNGTRWEQVALADPSARYELLPGAVVAEWATIPGPESGPGGQRFFQVSGGGLRPLIDGVALVANPGIGDNSQQFVAADGPYIVAENRSSGDWAVTDLRPLGDRPDWGRTDVIVSSAAALSNGGIVATVAIDSGLPTAPQTITSGDYQLRFGIDGEATLVNASTGERPGWWLSTDSGRIEVFETTEDGEPIGGAPLATFSENWTSIPALAWHRSEVLLVSGDGVTFDVIDPDEIASSAGLPGPLTLDELGDVRVDGERIIARLSQAPYPDLAGGDEGAGTDYILVGTPG